MKTKTTYLLLLSLISSLSLQAGEIASDGDRRIGGGNLSLAEVTASALANNPAIKESLRKLNAAKARITQAAAWDDLRVGGETRSWEPGKALIFDDMTMHEAWNDSERIRVILIADLWRPELSTAERATVTELMSCEDIPALP